MSMDAAPTITEFLLARIAEDEAVARAALPVPDVESPRWLPANLKKRFGVISGYEVDHIARHDPARVLAECAAKRAIVEAHQSYFTKNSVCMTCREFFNDDSEDYPCQTVRALAAVYSDNPDYQQEWAA